MEDEQILRYIQYLRSRITELRLQRNVSEHKMSLELGKSGSYIRAITSGTSLPSVTELFNIMIYFDLTPAQFFAGLEDSQDSPLCASLRELDEEDQQKVAQFITWIKK